MTDGEDGPGAQTLVDGGREKRQATRARLLKAARALFIERGFHDTRPQDISRAAGVGHGTFYLHFADKRECFLAFVDEAAAEIDVHVEGRLAGATTVPDMIRRILSATDEYVTANPGVIDAALVDPDIIGPGVRVTPRLGERWAGNWVNLLSRLREEGLVAADLDLRIVGHALVGLFHQAWALHERGDCTLADLEETLTRFIARGLAPPKK